MPRPATPPVLELLTIEQVAEMLQVSTRTVRRAIDARGLRAVQVAGRGTWRVRRQDLDAWLDVRDSGAATPNEGVAPAPAPSAPARKGPPPSHPALVAARTRVARRTGGRGVL